MKEQNYYFTFCGHHLQARNYVKIFGTYESTRIEMCKRYGDKWGFQYEEKEADEAVHKWGLKEIK